MSDTTVLPPILRLPKEIRMKIYRHILLSDKTIRMQVLHDVLDSIYPPNSLYPAILSTCHLIYDEAMDIVYRENNFRVHRVKDSNSNAGLITRAKFVIGIFTIQDREMEALGLTNFLVTHPNLKLLQL